MRYAIVRSHFCRTVIFSVRSTAFGDEKFLCLRKTNRQKIVHVTVILR